VIARETQAGHKAHFVVCSRGEAGTHGTPAQRTTEAKKSAALLGATIEFVDLGGDSHMEHKLAHVLTFAAIIRRIRPRIVLAPTTVENQHPDHVVVGRMVRDAARLARYGGVAELIKLKPYSIEQLMFYAVTVEAEPADHSAMLMDVSDQGRRPPGRRRWRRTPRRRRRAATSELHLARARARRARRRRPRDPTFPQRSARVQFARDARSRRPPILTWPPHAR
jgi:LmbE family N-acetylglucosaminyl deacetylase